MSPEDCRLEFWLMLQKALKDAGGVHSPEFLMKLKNESLGDFVEVMAQNGLRVSYHPNKVTDQ